VAYVEPVAIRRQIKSPVSKLVSSGIELLMANILVSGGAGYIGSHTRLDLAPKWLANSRTGTLARLFATKGTRTNG
jgi:hypothetical protein